MADPRDIFLPVSWSVSTPDDASMITVTPGRIAVRCGATVLGLDPDGTLAWTADLGDGAGEGTMLLAHGETVVTDTRTGPKRTTEVLGIHAGTVAYRTALDCLVGNQASALHGDELFVIGVAPGAGSVLRSMRITDGTRRLDLPRRGRDVIATRQRILVLDSFSAPGVVSLDVNGGNERVLEPVAAQEMRVAGASMLAAVRSGDSSDRMVQVRDVETGVARWSSSSHGASVALDDELAVHVDLVDGQPVPVARDAKTGALRWRGTSPLGDDTGIFRMAGSIIAFTHGTGTTLYRRTDGTFVGELLAVYALAAHGRQLWLEGSQRIACVDAPT